jgi:hypothetical protein
MEQQRDGPAAEGSGSFVAFESDCGKGPHAAKISEKA